MTYGRVIFGDNQFLGVNHSSQAKAVELYRHFADPNAIIEVLGAAHEAGIRDFMFTTHERYDEVFAEVRRSNLFPGMHYTPCLPYAHRYANAMSERGMVPMVWDMLRKIDMIKLFPAAARSLIGDFSGVMQFLVEIEMSMYKGLPVRGVFLQNIVFDLIMGLDEVRYLERFSRFVEDRLGAIPGFITMNHPAAVEIVCDRLGLEKPWLCANFNAGGFRMNPSFEAVEASFASGRTYNIAMSVFASGAADPTTALDHVLAAKGVDSLLFGSSRRENILANTNRIVEGTNGFATNG